MVYPINRAATFGAITVATVAVWVFATTANTATKTSYHRFITVPTLETLVVGVSSTSLPLVQGFVTGYRTGELSATSVRSTPPAFPARCIFTLESNVPVTVTAYLRNAGLARLYCNNLGRFMRAQGFRQTK